jgi:nucleoside-diphosphate-sugar epimerase
MTNLLEGRRIALIGGAGFIGHNLALSLAQQKAKVDVIDSLQVNNLLHFASGGGGFGPQRDLYTQMLNQRLDLLRTAGIAVHPQDARDYNALSRILLDIQPQVIVHLAAIAHAGKANKDPFSTFDHSLRTLENALDYARDGKVKVEHFVYFSSSMVYGNFMTPEVTEEHPLNSIGIYGALKVAGEKIVVAYNQVFDLPYTIIRPSALYGPRCVSRRVGQIFIESALQGKPLRIDGDGKERLDFTYIDDLIQGVELVLQTPAARNQTFNITYGQSRSILELIDVLKEAFPKIKLEFVERDKLMPFRGTLSIAKAKTLLGYSPENPIETGMPKYIDSYRSLDKYASV